MKHILKTLHIVILLNSAVSLAAPYKFTIVNNTGNAVTYNAQQINSGQSFQVQQNTVSSFATDPSLISDISSGASVYITDGTNPYTGDAAINYLKKLNNQVMVNDNTGNGITSGLIGSAQALDTRSYLFDSAGNGINSNNNSLNVNTRTSITANSPTNVSVGVSSTSILSSNSSRKGLVIMNLSTATVSIGIGNNAVLNSGITLYPGGVWTMDEFSLSTAAINGIASGSSSSVSVQEFQ